MNAISLEYYKAQRGAIDGIAPLDNSGKIPSEYMPGGSVETYKGEFADEAALIAAYATGSTADYAYVTDTLSFWYWNSGLATPAWVNQEITETAYLALSAAAKARVSYIIVP